jgi:hypothetical protein
VINMAGTLRVRRSRGALSGLLLVLLGIWGALIPFVGPYFHYAYTPDRVWTSTSGRMWLEVLPGVVTLVGGLVVLMSRYRPVAVFAAWLAALAGAWFAVGGLIAGRWPSLPNAGVPVGGTTMTLLEQVGFFTGLGVVIVFLAALALGRFTVVSVSDTVRASEPVLADDSVQAIATKPVSSRRSRVTPVKVFGGRSRGADDTETAPAETEPAQTR